MSDPSRRWRPADLLEELGISEPQDIRLEPIAQFCGATIVYEPLDGCEARILGYGDRAIITINERSPRFRQRFSGAHELGHWMRDRRQIAFSCTERLLSAEWGRDNPERRANRYAAELLLPEALFAPRARNLPIIFDSARSLARQFETSLTATAIRLVELGSYPSILVCIEDGRRRWFYPDPDVPRELRPRDDLHVDTVAYDLLRGGHDAGPTDVCAAGWFDHPAAHRYKIREDSVISSTTGLVLSLLWWEDECQLIDLAEED